MVAGFFPIKELRVTPLVPSQYGGASPNCFLFAWSRVELLQRPFPHGLQSCCPHSYCIADSRLSRLPFSSHSGLPFPPSPLSSKFGFSMLVSPLSRNLTVLICFPPRVGLFWIFLHLVTSPSLSPLPYGIVSIVCPHRTKSSVVVYFSGVCGFLDLRNKICRDCFSVSNHCFPVYVSFNLPPIFFPLESLFSLLYPEGSFLK